MPEGDLSAGYSKCPRLLVLFLAEVLGTAILLLFGCMGTCVTVIDMPVVPHLPSLSFGFVVMICIQVIGHISGAHINPQISLMAVILGKMELTDFGVYVLAQFIGACLGFGLLKLITPTEKCGEHLCLTAIHPDINLIQALVIEIAITTVLCLVFGAVLDPRNASRTDSTPLRFAITISGLCMVAAPFTGASMNTARSFAPALIHYHWKNHWIYWVGPTIGAILAGVFYRFILEPPIAPS